MFNHPISITGNLTFLEFLDFYDLYFLKIISENFIGWFALQYIVIRYLMNKSWSFLGV